MAGTSAITRPVFSRGIEMRQLAFAGVLLIAFVFGFHSGAGRFPWFDALVDHVKPVAATPRSLLVSPAVFASMHARARGAPVPDLAVHPGLIHEILGACAGEEPKFSRCTEKKQQIMPAFRAPWGSLDAAVTIGTCFIDGCEELVPASPVNACLWVSSIFDRVPDLQKERLRLQLIRLCEKVALEGGITLDDVRVEWKEAYRRSSLL